ncbi:MAG: response regulator [Hyphomonas sp.]
MSNALLNRPKNVAVIDDSEAVRRSLVVLLTTRGYAAMGFASGSEFLSSPLRNSFDFLLVDYKMDDMSGVDLLRTLRDDGLDVPAAMVSGWETPGLERLAQSAGFAAFIRKPMLDHMLFSLIGPPLPVSIVNGADGEGGAPQGPKAKGAA